MTSMTDRISEHMIQYCQTWNMPFFLSPVIFFRNPIGLILDLIMAPLGVALKRSKQNSESQGWTVGDELLGIILANFCWGFQTKPMGLFHGIQVMFVVLDPLKILAGYLSFLLSHQPAILGEQPGCSEYAAGERRHGWGGWCASGDSLRGGRLNRQVLIVIPSGKR